MTSPGTSRAPRRALDGLLSALTFLTILPLRVRAGHDGAAVAPMFHALVGAAIGAFGGGVLAATEPAVGPVTAATLAVTCTVILTGALHQDGLADCADGLGVRGSRERRLAVMRDPRVGTFGTLALVLWALLLTTSLAQMDTRDAVAALVSAAAAGRWAALLHARWTPPARTDGLGAAFVPTSRAVLAGGLSVVVLAAALEAAAAVAVTLTAGAVAALVSSGARRALGGRTGDTLGATVVLTDLAVVLVLLAVSRS